MSKTFYMYDENGEYCGEQMGFLDPLETEAQGKNVYLIPSYATDKKPTQKDGFVPVWDGSTWVQKEDHRGEMYYPKDAVYGDAPEEMKTVGALPEGATTEAPVQPLEDLRSEKLTELTEVHAKWRDDEAYFVSSLGFKADGKTATINDISLLWSMADLVGKAYTCAFVDYDNQPHELSYEQVKQLYIEAGMSRQQGYAEKWLMRNMIESAETADGIANVELKFTPVDFTKSK